MLSEEKAKNGAPFPILEHIDSGLVSAVKYVLLAVLLFSFSAAIFSFFSGETWQDFSVTGVGANILSSVIALALIIVWREARELRIWLEGISRRHSKESFPLLEKHLPKSKLKEPPAKKPKKTGKGR